MAKIKLIFTPLVTYVHKALVVAGESGVLDQMTYERVVPFAEDTGIWQFTPIGKVPAMVMPNGEPLYSGLIMCEYLDSLSKGKRLFPQDETRWRAMRQMALGDAVFDATTLLRVKSWHKKEHWDMRYMLRERQKIMNALDQLERDAAGWKPGEFHIGHVCTAGGLSYLDLSCPINSLQLEPGDQDFSWRNGHPRLSAWFDEVRKRPSMDMVVAHRAIGALNEPTPGTENRAGVAKAQATQTA